MSVPTGTSDTDQYDNGSLRSRRSGRGPRATRESLAVRLAARCVRQSRLVIVGWMLIVGAALATLASAGGHYRTDFRVPGSDSQRAQDALVAHFPGYRGDRELLVVHTERGVMTDPQPRAALARLVAQLRAVPGVASVGDPLSTTQARISADDRTSVTVLQFRQPTDSVPLASVRQVLTTVTRASGRLIDIGLIGQATENAEAYAPNASETVAFGAVVIVLLIGFGSAVAVAVALAAAGVGLSAGLAAMDGLSHLIAIPTFATQVATTVGLGVGIDYALLILARHRAAARHTGTPAAAAIDAMRSSGRAVTFAGATVIVAMFGLYAVPLPFVHGLAIGVSVVVIPMIAVAVTLLPALLVLLGPHLDRGRLPMLGSSDLGTRSRRWSRWSRRVQTRPIAAAAAALMLLASLSMPVLAMRLGNTDASTDNANTPSHHAYTYSRRAFGPGLAYPLTIVATITPPNIALESAVHNARAVLAATPGVATLGPTRLSTTRHQFAVDIYPASAPNAQQRAALLQRLRGHVREALKYLGVSINVGGTAAINADLAHAVSRSLPVVLAAVIGISLLLLLVLFRSVVVAVKAAVMNLLSVAAAFGVVVAVFQWGWGLHLIGVDYPGPLEVFLPLLLFPVVFGLSMDYEVFIVSAIRRQWDRTHNNSEAITGGIATTGRIVTSGAAVMVVLFAALVLSDARTVKMFGLALAVAISVDALIVRALLLPATMQLLGRNNWWLPHWLDQRLPPAAAHTR